MVRKILSVVIPRFPDGTPTYNKDGVSIANYIMQCELESGGSSVRTFENWDGLTLFVKNLESF